MIKPTHILRILPVAVAAALCASWLSYADTVPFQLPNLLGATSPLEPQNLDGSGEFQLGPSMVINVEMGDTVFDLDHEQSPGTELVPAPASGNFVYIGDHGYDAGLSPAPTGNVATGAFVGLVPILGKEIITHQVIPNPEATKGLPKLKLPTTAEDLDNWSAGNQISYSTHGAVQFLIGYGYSIVGANLDITAEGIWTFAVAKIDADTVQIHASNEKLDSIEAQQGATFVQLSEAEYKELTDGFIFKLSLKKDEDRQAINKLLAGDFQTAQRLSGQSGLAADAETSLTEGRFFQFTLGFPLLNWNWFSQHTHSDYKSVSLLTGTTTEIQYGVYARRTNAQFLAYSQDSSIGFVGARILESGPQVTGPSATEYGQLAFSHDASSASAADIQGSVTDLIRETGLDALAITVADPHAPAGTTAISFMMTIPEAETETLMALSTERQSIAQLHSSAEAMIQDYFSDPSFMTNELFDMPTAGMAHQNQQYFMFKDKMRYCERDNWNKDKCLETVQYDEKSALKKILKSAKAMSQARSDENAARSAGNSAQMSAAASRFAVSYSQLGQALLSSPFVFQATLRWLHSDKIIGTLRISSPNFREHDTKVSWNGTKWAPALP